jgi:hypothetical protein
VNTIGFAVMLVSAGRFFHAWLRQGCVGGELACCAPKPFLKTRVLSDGFLRVSAFRFGKKAPLARNGRWRRRGQGLSRKWMGGGAISSTPFLF